MWIITPPSSTIRRASAAYSSGVYGIAGHCSRLAIAPEIEQVITTGTSRLTAAPLFALTSPVYPWLYGRHKRSTTTTRRVSPSLYGRRKRSYRHHALALPRPLDLLVLGHLKRPADRLARLAR